MPRDNESRVEWLQFMGQTVLRRSWLGRPGAHAGIIRPTPFGIRRAARRPGTGAADGGDDLTGRFPGVVKIAWNNANLLCGEHRIVAAKFFQHSIITVSLP